MMTDITWGDPIPVDGKRPDWLRDELPQILSGDNVWLDSYGKNSYWSWRYIDAIRLPSDHPYYTVQRHNAQNGTDFTYWPGGENAPNDWDRGKVLLREYVSTILPSPSSWDRGYGGDPHKYAELDVIGYTRRAEPLAGTDGPAQWAVDQAIDFINAESTNRTVNAFARYIEQHEQPPVDPDVLAVREILAQYTLHFDESYTTDEMYVKGRCDDTTWFQSALAVYRKHRQ